MSLQIGNAFQVILDKNGSPLDGGYVFIGEVGQNPEAYPIQIFYDENLTIPVPQPVKTINGYFARNGNAAKIFCAVSSCSITVRDRNRALQWLDLGYTGVLNQEIQDAVKRGIANRYDPLLTYNSGERVVLTNGDIVKSTIDGNTNDPNANMVGWATDNAKAPFQNKNVHIISGALRNDGTGWAFISDSLHNPINVTSVEVVNNIDLKVNFEGTGNKVIYGSVNCDESYSRLGLQVGPSVGVGSLTLRGYLPLEFSVTTDGANAPIISAIDEIKSRITPSRSGTKIRVNHTGSVLDYPQVTAVSGSPKASPIDVTPTAMNILQETGQTPYYFRIWAGGGTWNITSNMAGVTLTTTNFATNGTITVNLPTAITGNDFNLQSTSDRYKDSRGVIFLSKLSSFDVKFVDTATNAYRTSIPSDGIADTTFQYGINKGGVNTATTLPAGTYNVKRGLIPVYWNEIKSPDSYAGNANLWFTAQIEYQ